MNNQEIIKPKHYTAGHPEVIDIIAAWGYEGDFCAANVLKYFLRSPYKGTEEKDLRKAMWYLDRIHKRDIGNYVDFLCHDRINCTPMKLRREKIHLIWFKVLNYESEITLKDVIDGWALEGLRQEFIRNFHYQHFNCDKCIKILSELIDEISDYEDEDEDL